ncbi:LOW QUALITY PROTEIN: putative deoxyribonuclease tatdn3 [Melanotaenia boesemani]|uniref:LOW QUALITY PROTEIN: putative deoxyribonuclease tatdn3 n=1 Tax=Melanotaenia boesemani TaxID=1250792 RepID=UPI001C03B3A6|nr:LOW QUALITY PROTEIN: putative deoxyribonuclease tatdn3 [Melanotaenia boesemani]
MDYDCHCHLSAREFEQDLEDVIQRSREAGVKTSITVTEEAGEFSRVLQLQERFPDLVSPCFGVHLLQTSGGLERRSAMPQDLDAARSRFYVHRNRLVAVGEIGLDFTPWCALTQRDRDNQVFVKQLDIAKELDLPVNIHSRSAAGVTIETMKEHGISRALLHNFAGKLRVGLEGVKAGFFFSFPPAVCRNQQRQKLIKLLPLEHICLETDSPSLGLQRHERSAVRNEDIALSCRYMSEVKGVSPQKVQVITAQNAYRIFSKAPKT